METIVKHLYQAPSADFVSTDYEVVVCASPEYAPEFNRPFNNEEEW